MVRLLLARQREDPPAVAEQARRLQALAEAPEAARSGLGEELRALALIRLGSIEHWVARFQEAERYLEQGIALARRIGRPYLELPAWPTRGRSSSSARLPWRWNGAGRRPSWPNGTAGPASRPPAWRAY